MLNPDRGADVAVHRDVGRNRGEVQFLRRQRDPGAIGKDSTRPTLQTVPVLLIADHAANAQQVDTRRIGWSAPLVARRGCQELAQRQRISGIDPLIGVELQNPSWTDGLKRVDKSLSVRRIVPTFIRRTNRVAQKCVHQRMRLKQGGGVVGAAIIERNNNVGDARHALEPTGEIRRGIARRQQTRDSRTRHGR